MPTISMGGQTLDGTHETSTEEVHLPETGRDPSRPSRRAAPSMEGLAAVRGIDSGERTSPAHARP
jgi:hypothetical protein